jgi:hypothetical protein
VPDGDDELGCRVLVDESSFTFLGRTPDQLTEALEYFNDALATVMDTHPVAVSPWWTEHECLEGYVLAQFLYERGGPGESVSRDERRRTAALMDKCRSWDPDATPDAPSGVTVAGQTHESWTLGHAVCRTRDGYSTACLLFAARADLSGWQPVASEAGEVELFFLRSAPQLTAFWRDLYQRENVQAPNFFSLAGHAFPALVMAPTLTFRRFDGSYRDLREWVVQALSALNDSFADALEQHAGIPARIQAEFGRFHVDLSPESTKTQANADAMRQRSVKHDDGETYSCVWHAKQHPARNRIHFSLPDQRLGGKILVGVFVDHLPT